MKGKIGSYDFILILTTVAVLFVMSAICVYSMFYFKMAEVHNMAPALKAAYMNRMNVVIAPFITMLLLLVGICVPKRLLPERHLNWVALLLLAAFLLLAWWQGVKFGLLIVLLASLVLQLAVLVLAVIGSDRIYFTKTGYWVRVGSSSMHLGLILFVLDLYFYKHQALHLALFWVTTAATVAGMVFCFYTTSILQLLGIKPKSAVAAAGLAGGG